MIQGMWFDYLAALLASISAAFWAWSAKVQIPTGYDVGAEQREAFGKAGKLNATAAGFAAGAAALPAVKAFGTFLRLVAS